MAGFARGGLPLQPPAQSEGSHKIDPQGLPPVWTRSTTGSPTAVRTARGSEAARVGDLRGGFARRGPTLRPARPPPSPPAYSAMNNWCSTPTQPLTVAGQGRVREDGEGSGAQKSEIDRLQFEGSRRGTQNPASSDGSHGTQFQNNPSSKILPEWFGIRECSCRELSPPAAKPGPATDVGWPPCQVPAVSAPAAGMRDRQGRSRGHTGPRNGRRHTRTAPRLKGPMAPPAGSTRTSPPAPDRLLRVLRQRCGAIPEVPQPSLGLESAGGAGSCRESRRE